MRMVLLHVNSSYLIKPMTYSIACYFHIDNIFLWFHGTKLWSAKCLNHIWPYSEIVKILTLVNNQLCSIQLYFLMSCNEGVNPYGFIELLKKKFSTFECFVKMWWNDDFFKYRCIKSQGKLKENIHILNFCYDFIILCFNWVWKCNI